MESARRNSPWRISHSLTSRSVIKRGQLREGGCGGEEGVESWGRNKRKREGSASRLEMIHAPGTARKEGKSGLKERGGTSAMICEISLFFPLFLFPFPLNDRRAQQQSGARRHNVFSSSSPIADSSTGLKVLQVGKLANYCMYIDTLHPTLLLASIYNDIPPPTGIDLFYRSIPSLQADLVNADATTLWSSVWVQH